MKKKIISSDTIKKIKSCGMEFSDVKNPNDLKWKLKGYEACRKDILKIIEKDENTKAKIY